MIKKVSIYIVSTFLSLNSYAGTLYCENYDLATADILGEQTLNADLDNLKSTDINLIAESHLVTSQFFLNYDKLNKVFYFKIYSKESVVESSSIFKIDESKFQKKFQLGFNSIELTGLGDNVHARCFWNP